MAMDGPTRVAVLEIGHWHASEYLNGLVRCPEAELVAVSERDRAVLDAKAQDLECRRYTDYRRLLDEEDVDFAFMFGTHRQMPSIAAALVERGIPFSSEKPLGTSLDDLIAIGERLHERPLFNAVSLYLRRTPWIERLRETMSASPGSRYFSGLAHFSFGYPARYVEQGVGWMLRREDAGGGCLVNLGVHLLDLARYLAGDLELRAALFSRAMHEGENEDYAHILVEAADSSVWALEMNYRFSERKGRSGFIISTSLGSVVAGEDWWTTATLTRPDGEQVVWGAPERYGYGAYVCETLRRFRSGEPAIATVADMTEVWRLVDAAYREGQWL